MPLKKVPLLLFNCAIALFANSDNYAISVCTTSSYESAVECKNKYPMQNSYVIEHDNRSFNTVYGKFSSVEEAKKFRNTLPREYRGTTEDLSIILLVAPSGTIRFEKKVQPYVKIQTSFEELPNPKTLNKIILKINSSSHRMQVYGINQYQQIQLKSYIVSTARKNTKKPIGEGGISAVSINPVWYPTEETVENFRDKKGIELPSVVPAGDPLNYMGLAKINLTHRVDGRNTYRIHGTFNEKTIGTNESSGCIRMKNKDVLELAQFLKLFAKLNGLQNIRVLIQ